MFNKDRLITIIKEYEGIFKESRWKDEKFKWEAIKTFNEFWDINAEDFSEMVKQAFSKTQGLLASYNNFPLGVLQFFAQKDPETLREMFISLYDESIEITQRINAFKDKSVELIKKYGKKGDNHYQSENAISVYLWLKYPDKYYIYKYGIIKSIEEILDCPKKIVAGKTEANFLYGQELYSDLNNALKEDGEALDILSSCIDKNCYEDSNMITMTIDLAHYMDTVVKKKKKNERSIGHMEETRIWKISHGTDATGISKENRAVFLDRNVIVVNKNTKPKGNTKVAQGDAFMNKIKAGDYFYLCFGNSIQLLGRISDDDVTLNQELKDGWYERKYEIISKSKNLNPYVGEKKWWTPNDNSTCIEVDDKKMFEELILEPYFNMKFNENGIPDSNRGYWWVTTNPKMWSFESLRPGGCIEFLLKNSNGNKKRIYQNFLDARKGDFVIGYESNPTKQIVALCEVAEEQNGECLLVRKLRNVNNPVDYSTIKDCTELENMEYFKAPQGTIFKLTKDEYEFIIDLVNEENPVSQEEQYDTYTEEDFLKEVFMEEDKYVRLKNLLIKKKNIILQGAPGVGKTFTAEKLAYSIIGKKDSSKVQFVQFHQNYSYEDFIMGYRPCENGFELRYGIFYQFCKKAANDPGNKYFFIIDEINRGNLSKIFGELLMLIEKDYREKDIVLAYNGLPFQVPENLYIIGMMNTADRSLALIDYALRRRFSFFEMKPGFDSKGFKKYQEKIGNPVFDKLIDKIILLNHKIEKDPSLGKGFCIGHSYFCTNGEVSREWMESVVEYDIIPMIEEYWFDDNDTLNTEAEILRGIFNDK